MFFIRLIACENIVSGMFLRNRSGQACFHGCSVSCALFCAYTAPLFRNTKRDGVPRHAPGGGFIYICIYIYIYGPKRKITEHFRHIYTYICFAVFSLYNLFYFYVIYFFIYVFTAVHIIISVFPCLFLRSSPVLYLLMELSAVRD